MCKQHASWVGACKDYLLILESVWKHAQTACTPLMHDCASSPSGKQMLRSHQRPYQSADDQQVQMLVLLCQMQQQLCLQLGTSWWLPWHNAQLCPPHGFSDDSDLHPASICRPRFCCHTTGNKVSSSKIMRLHCIALRVHTSCAGATGFMLFSS